MTYNRHPQDKRQKCGRAARRLTDASPVVSLRCERSLSRRGASKKARVRGTAFRRCACMPAIKSDSGEWTAAGGRTCPSAAFDLAALLRRSMNDRSLAAMLIEKFTARLGRTVEEIHQLVAAGDWPAAGAKVHTLKGE